MPTVDVTEAALSELFAATRETAERGPLCAAQVAVAQAGRLVGFETFGRATFEGVERAATNETLFTVYSCTKAVTSSAAWILLQERRIRLGDRVADHIPDFGTNGKGAVTVEHLLTHTAGFPGAGFDSLDWLDPARRLAAFASWELEWEPGTRFVYHGTATMWALAEIITRVSGTDYRDFIQERIVDRAGLRDLTIGVPESELARVADVVPVGKPMTDAETAVAPVEAPVVGDDDIEFANSRSTRMVGSPSGGARATAAALAMFYQALLADERGSGPGVWDRAMLSEAWRIRDPSLIDPMTGRAADRGLGVVVSGDENRMWRGFPLACSPRAFGHMGAGGQVAWADPETGVSFVYLTNGADRNAIRQGATGVLLSTLATSCFTSAG